MANTKSAQKATRKIDRLTAVNKSRRSRVRSYVRRVELAIDAGNKTEAVVALKAAQPELVRAANKGVFHQNSAARKISRLAKRIKTLG